MQYIRDSNTLVINDADIQHIISWFQEGVSLKEAIQTEMFLHGVDDEDVNTDSFKVQLNNKEGDVCFSRKMK